ncbi:RNA-binding protein S1 [Pseudothermotoga hypogea DSM 11164 = NBRC 106472]|uniref:RNA-binding protein S1 n=1 Tax=Pseudothermotoga hypogea DSM 11164 = NBRC 106472 TaxID=1123384 RepID=A0A0X1KRU2_9THEM|nr:MULTISPECIES: 30S ribosomal protein S1 [Pseudothermotoga]AJC73910.1 RNA-binding protein S1 [Pseudothermotoga hypogea DSM 11164 = NBRC 106472]MBC7122730.1 30S ribosomal protein S1 [Pseudothermotoga sp.]MDI6862149.1 30S ribosomal protein S1 [Pseudothermotoga sp.]
MEKENASMKDFEKYLDLAGFGPGQVVEATVTGVDPAEGLSVDFGGKQEGRIQPSELVREPSSYKVGEKITAQILKINDEEGYAMLSELRPHRRMAERKVREAKDSGTPVKGYFVQQVSGGYIVKLFNVLDAFLPGSESLLRRDAEIPQGEHDFLIIDYTAGRRGRIVVSRKALVERQIQTFFESHKVGDVVEAKVERVRSSGATLKIGPLTATLPREEVSHDPSVSIHDALKEGETIKVKIVKLDPAQRLIEVSLKALEPDPWQTAAEKYRVGTIVRGVVKNIVPFGVFVNLEPGLDGLIHVSEIFWSSKKVDLKKFFKPGQMVEAEVVEVDPEKRRLALSYKRAQGDPWENVMERYKEGDIVEGTIVKVLPTGLIVEIEDGVTGLVPKSELSWNKVSDPGKLFRERQSLKMKILSIDSQNRRMRLSVKQTTPDPWEKAAESLKEGSVARAIVKAKLNSGYVLQLKDFSVEAFMPSSHAPEEMKEGAEIEVLVLRIIPERRKILVSQKKLEEMKDYEEYKKQMGGSQKTLGDFLKK